MNERIRENKITKLYMCAVIGKLLKKQDTLSDYLIKDSKSNTVKVLKNTHPGAKEIITKYEVKAYNEAKNLSLLEIELITGRTHQIRAHMSSIGHPLLGDGKYGNIAVDKKLGYKHQALYAYKVIFGDSNDTLSYLNRKTVSANRENIYFLREFK